MPSFAEMKKARNTSVSSLRAEVERLNAKSEYAANSERFWKPTTDKMGNGSAVIRFLPAPDGEAVPFVRYFRHFFKGPNGQIYSENSLTSLGQSDPVSEYNSLLWNSTSDDNSPARKQARDQKRQLKFVSNIYVVKDPGNPENEGKVFLYEYGQKIFAKIEEKMTPRYEDEEPVNVFDLWSGANFRIKIKKVGGYINYDDSSFASPNALLDSDEDLEKIWKKTQPLKPFVDPSNFKTYNQLKERLDIVLGLSSSSLPKPTKAEDTGTKPPSRNTYTSMSSGDDDDIEMGDLLKNILED